MNADYPFYVSPRNRKGITLFFLICLTVIFLPRIVRSFDKPLSINLSKTAIETFNEKRNWHKKKEYQKKSRPAYKKKVFLAPERCFDPNQYQKNDWIKLGLSEKQVAVVLKFTEKGLYSNDDLEKINERIQELSDELSKEKSKKNGGRRVNHRAKTHAKYRAQHRSKKSNKTRTRR